MFRLFASREHNVLPAHDPSVAGTELPRPKRSRVSRGWSHRARWVITLGVLLAGVLCLVVGGPLSHAVAAPPVRTTSVGSTPSPGTAQGTAACDDSLFTNPNCWLQNRLTALAASLAQGTIDLLRPLIVGVINSHYNFISHTPTAITYAPDAPVQAFVSFFLTVIDAALGVVILITGYNIMLGRYIGLTHSLAEYLPRIILSVIAAHMSMLFVQWMIDLNNQLTSSIILLHDLTVFTTILQSIFRGTIVSHGWIIFFLALALCVMTLLLLGQMLVRLAFLLVLIAGAPLGIFCFALPQTQSCGWFWLSNFVSTVFVQVLQVTTLTLGSVLLSQLLNPTRDLLNLIPFVADILPLATGIAVLYLVIRLPGMLRAWSLRSVAAEAGTAAFAAAQGTAEFVAQVAPRLAELLAA